MTALPHIARPGGRYYAGGQKVRRIWQRGERVWLPTSDLIHNGDAASGTNDNFTDWVYSSDAPPGGSGSFRYTGGSTALFSDEWIEIDAARAYRLRFWAKCADGSALHYVGLSFADYDKQAIFSEHYLIHNGSALTTLAQPLSPGDTLVHLSDATGWADAGASHQRNIRFGHYLDSRGRSYGAYGYSPWGASPTGGFTRAGVYGQGAISGGTITLTAPYGGRALAAGHPVANAQYGNNYMYLILNDPIPGAWTEYDLTASANRIWPGSHYARFLVLGNRGVPSAVLHVGRVRLDAATV